MYKSTPVCLFQLPLEPLEVPCFFPGNRFVPVEDALENFGTAYKEITLLAPAITTLAPVALCNHCRQLRDDKHFTSIKRRISGKWNRITVNWK